METTTDYVALATSALDKCKTYLEDNWEFVSKSDKGTTLHRMYDRDVSAFPCFKTSTTIDNPIDQLISKIWDVNESIVKANDNEIGMWREVESGPNWKVCYQFNTMQKPLFTRELLFVQVKIRDGDGTTWLVGTSIEDHPNKGSHNYWWYVRAHIHMSIWGFKPIANNKTQVSRIVHVEPGGLIPPEVVNAMVSKHVKIIEKLAE